MTPEERLDKWWDTEPFGWDNPDTYFGILKLIKEVILEEQYECAKIADELEHCPTTHKIAQAIMARGTEK